MADSSEDSLMNNKYLIWSSVLIIVPSFLGWFYFLKENEPDNLDIIVNQDEGILKPIIIYSNEEYGFSFDYPEQFNIFNGDELQSLPWMQNSDLPGTLLVKVELPKTLEPKTNFSEAFFTVGKSDKVSDEENCLNMSNGNAINTSKVFINGIDFVKIDYGDAGAGNFYDITSYRTIFGGECFAIEYLIHSTNIGVYSPSQGITEYDKEKIEEILKNMSNSFRFL